MNGAELSASDEVGRAGFPYRQWWVAAFASDVGRHLTRRVVLGTPIVLYRTEEGRPVALDDRCPHRGFPLSKSRLIADSIECGYHGFTFDCSGECIRIPSQARIPARADARSFPCVERSHFVWIWTGPPGEADPSTIPDPGTIDAEMTVISGSSQVAGQWQDMHENLMDVTHFSFLHQDGIASVAFAAVEPEVTVDDGRVRVVRRLIEDPPPAVFARTMGTEGPVERESTMEYRSPGLEVATVTGTPVTASGERLSGTCCFRILHAITPISEQAFGYHWVIGRDYAIGDPQVSERFQQVVATAVRQDLDALEWIAQSRAEHASTSRRQVTVKSDGPSLTALRLIREAIEQESRLVVGVEGSLARDPTEDTQEDNGP